jgi:hypothetical protein
VQCRQCRTSDMAAPRARRRSPDTDWRHSFSITLASEARTLGRSMSGAAWAGVGDVLGERRCGWCGCCHRGVGGVAAHDQAGNRQRQTRNDQVGAFQPLAASRCICPACISGNSLGTPWINNNSVDWTVRVVTGALLIWMLVSDLGSWRRFRPQRKPNDPPAAAS